MYKKAISGIALFYVILFIGFWCVAVLKIGAGVLYGPAGGNLTVAAVGNSDVKSDDTDNMTAVVSASKDMETESNGENMDGENMEDFLPVSGDMGIQDIDGESMTDILLASGNLQNTGSGTYENLSESEEAVNYTLSDRQAVELQALEKTEYVVEADAEDLEALCRIVEAEAGSEDEKGRILVADVVLNRVINDNFPDTIKEVVLQQKNGVAQFSPVGSGRYYEVEISEETYTAVEKALKGEDISGGALFFMARKRAGYESIRWFEENLTFLFEHGGHEFYSY